MKHHLFLYWKGFEPIETEDEPSQSDDQNTGSLSEVTADEISSIPVLEGFEPIETEDEPSQSDDQNAENLSEVTADETSSIPVLEGFEPIETKDEPLQSDDQNAEASQRLLLMKHPPFLYWRVLSQLKLKMNHHSLMTKI